MGLTTLRLLSETPYNAEPQLTELIKHKITPLELVYARNHSKIRDLRSDIANTYTIKIDGEVPSEKTITYKDLLSFPRKEVVAALVCAGNRRVKMAEKTGREVRGIKWADGAVCNVLWAGARLRDVLLSAGASEMNVDMLHACFTSQVAVCEDDASYGGSIPLRDALSEEGEVLLAYEMNGEALTPDHGYPVRVVVPGTYGMRWVKWVDQVTISRQESPNFYQQRDYKILPDTVLSKAAADSEGWWSRCPSMQHLACNSAVVEVRLAASCPDQIKLKVTGYAYSCCPIVRVDTSIDAGRTWEPAKIKYQQGSWSWTLWEAYLEIMLDDETKEGGAIAVKEDKNGCLRRVATVLSRAVDYVGKEQELGCKWNLRGVGYSGAGERSIVI